HRTNAATRHGIWFATLLLLVALVPSHYWLANPNRHMTRVIPEKHLLVAQRPAPAQQTQRVLGFEDRTNHPLLLAFPSGKGWSGWGEAALSTEPVTREQTSSVGSQRLTGSWTAVQYVRELAGRFFQPLSWEIEQKSQLVRLTGLLLLFIWVTVA